MTCEDTGWYQRRNVKAATAAKSVLIDKGRKISLKSFAQGFLRNRDRCGLEEVLYINLLVSCLLVQIFRSPVSYPELYPGLNLTRNPTQIQGRVLGRVQSRLEFFLPTRNLGRAPGRINRTGTFWLPGRAQESAGQSMSRKYFLKKLFASPKFYSCNTLPAPLRDTHVMKGFSWIIAHLHLTINPFCVCLCVYVKMLCIFLSNNYILIP